MNRLISLFCLPALCLADAPPAPAAGEELAVEQLIAGPGDKLALEAPEAGGRIEAALDGGPLTPVGDSITAPAAGDHWLALASRDPSSNLSTIRWVRLRVDAEAPRVALDTEPAPVERGRLWMPPVSRVSAAAEDALAGVGRLFLAVGDGTSETVEDTVRASLPAEGTARVRAWAVDKVGNRSAETTLELAIDSTPPAGEIRAGCAQAAGAVVPPSCPIEVRVIDDESGGERWTARIDGEEADASDLEGPWTAGPHTVEVGTVDAVGNAGRVGPYPFVVDDTGPEIVWRVTSPGVEGAGGETVYRPPVTVAVEASDAPAGLEALTVAPDGSTYRPIDGPVEVDGDRLAVRARDRVGNASDVEARWRIDVDPPEIGFETLDGRSVEAGEVVELERGDALRVTTSDAGAGLEGAVYRFGVETWRFWRRWWWNQRPKPLPETLALRRIGEIELTVEATDRLGNPSTASRSLVVRRPGGGS